MRPWSYSALALYETCPRAYKLRYIDKIKDLGNEAMDRGNKVHSQLEDFLQKDAPLPEEAEGLAAYCVELKEQTPVVEEDWGFTETWDQTGYYADDIWCRMKLDVFIPGDDLTKVIDWKTGKHYPVKAMDQGQLYAVGASLKTDANLFEVSFVYVDQDLVKTTKYKRAQVDRFKEKFTKRATRLGMDDTFKPKPHKFTCRYCPMRAHCNYMVDE